MVPAAFCKVEGPVQIAPATHWPVAVLQLAPAAQSESLVHVLLQLPAPHA